MSMITDTDPVYFVYSEIQVDETNKVLSKLNKEFICGSISIGTNYKKFSKIIKQSELDAMIRYYPDVKIIAKGIKTKFKYTEPVEQTILE